MRLASPRSGCSSSSGRRQQQQQHAARCPGPLSSAAAAAACSRPRVLSSCSSSRRRTVRCAATATLSEVYSSTARSDVDVDGPSIARPLPLGLFSLNALINATNTANTAATTAPANTPSEVLSSTPLAGGVLEVVQWEVDRRLRVWLPPGYDKEAGKYHPYPVLYMNDGQNVFGDCHTLSGCSWQAAEAAAELITAGQLPPFLLVGIDHAGLTRSLEYTPYAPGTGLGGFRADAAHWPGGGVAQYLQRLRQEVLPWVATQYAASMDPADLGFGGSSFGAVAALWAGMQASTVRGGCPFGALLVESPSLWMAQEAFLQDIQAYSGAWPARVYVGMGGKEFSGTRSGRGEQHDRQYTRHLQAMYAALTEQGLGPDRLAWAYDPHAAHTEEAWAQRLPAALQFVAGGWWLNWVKRQQVIQQHMAAAALADPPEHHHHHMPQHQGLQQHLLLQRLHQATVVCTWPPRLVADAEGQMLFFNRSASRALAHLPQGTQLRAIMGHNGWHAPTKLTLQPLSALLQHSVETPCELQRNVFEQWGLQPDVCEHLQRQQHIASQATGAGLAAYLAANSKYTDDWHVLMLPCKSRNCYQLDFAFCDASEQTWDNNDGADYRIAVFQEASQAGPGAGPDSRGPSTQGRRGTAAAARPATAPPRRTVKRGSAAQLLKLPATNQLGAGVGQLSAYLMCSSAGDGCGMYRPEALLQAAVRVLKGADAPATKAAAAAATAGEPVFFMPPRPVGGMPVTIYVNKARLYDGMRSAPNMCLTVGFNGWTLCDPVKVSMHPTSLARDDNHDWWSGQLTVPVMAHQGAFAISAVSNGHEMWDNNQGADYTFPVVEVETEVLQAFTSAAGGRAGRYLVQPALSHAVSVLSLCLDV